MSERISWHTCPRCGETAAVGWNSTLGADGQPAGYAPVEFDCLTGCQLSPAQLATAFDPPPSHRLPSAGHLARPR